MSFKHLSTILSVLVLPLFTCAQKLPNVQESSVRAPDGIKIDGKADEWNNKFKAHNSATDIFYTISNDDQNLYLTIEATDHTVINKILGSGIIFSIDTSGKRNSGKDVSIRYPALDMHNRVWVNLKDQPQGASVQEVSQAEATMKIKNKEFRDKSKYIGLKGFKGLDTLISVYNHDGIKAAGSFNNKLFFTCELSVDLKKLGLDISNPKMFTYSIKLPGVNMVAVYAASGQAASITEQGYVIPAGPLPGFTEEYIEKNLPSLPFKVHMVDFTSTTTLSGEYLLSKK